MRAINNHRASSEAFITPGCYTGKRGFLSRAAAKDAARKTLARYGRMRPYACSHCGFWHIGHVPAAVKAGLR
jgi:hypothetical protein